MRLTISALIAALVLTLAAQAQRREDFQAIQRDLALLDADVKDLSKRIDEKMKSLEVLIQQSADNSNKITSSVTLLEANLRDKMKEQEKTLVAPIASMGTKVDQMSDELRFVRESVADLNSKFAKLQNQVVDLSNAIKVMQAPPPPPGSVAAGGPATPPPGVSAEALYRDAYRDKLGGKNEIALQQFQDYLRYFPNTDLAPSAQYFIGEIHYLQGAYDAALPGFDAVLERYGENSSKANDAQLMKGRTLVKLGQRTAAAEEFRALLKRQPTGEYATKARAELKSLGFSIPPTSRTKQK